MHIRTDQIPNQKQSFGLPSSKRSKIDSEHMTKFDLNESISTNKKIMKQESSIERKRWEHSRIGEGLIS